MTFNPTASIPGFSPSSMSFATLQNAGNGGGSSTTVASSKPVQFQLPPWLTTNPDDLAGELMNQYKTVGQQFNTTGIARAYDKSISSTQGMGGQIAENAARESISRAGQEGGDVNSAMVKAQSMLPVYDQTNSLRKDKALAIADVHARQAQMQTGLASAIANMRTSYLSMLADSYMRGQGMNNQFFQQQQSHGLAQQQFDWQRYLQSNALSVGNNTRSSAPTGPFQGQITRAPNNSGMGGVEFTPQYSEYLKAAGIENRTAPQYPAGGGVGFGNSLDQYNSMFRGMLSDANGRPAWSQVNSDSADAQMMAGGYAAPDKDAMARLVASLKPQKLTY